MISLGFECHPDGVADTLRNRAINHGVPESVAAEIQTHCLRYTNGETLDIHMEENGGKWTWEVKTV